MEAFRAMSDPFLAMNHRATLSDYLLRKLHPAEINNSKKAKDINFKRTFH